MLELRRKEGKRTVTSIRVPTCRKNSSIRALVQRECSAQGLDGWLMSAVWSNRDSALGLSILLAEAWWTFFFLLCLAVQTCFKINNASQRDTNLPPCAANVNQLLWTLIRQKLNFVHQRYRSCCCRQAFIALTWSRWEDMSVDNTISITRDRSSL